MPSDASTSETRTFSVLSVWGKVSFHIIALGRGSSLSNSLLVNFRNASRYLARFLLAYPGKDRHSGDSGIEQ